MKLEQHGVPTASLCTSPFVELAHRQARSLGMPEIPVVHIRERLADRTMDELRELVDDALEDIVAAVVIKAPAAQSSR